VCAAGRARHRDRRSPRPRPQQRASPPPRRRRRPGAAAWRPGGAARTALHRRALCR
jgi:hypothetical protein